MCEHPGRLCGKDIVPAKSVEERKKVSQEDEIKQASKSQFARPSGNFPEVYPNPTQAKD